MYSLRATLPVALSLLTLVSPGCSTAITEPAVERVEFPIAAQKSGSYSRLGRSVRIVARDAATLAQFSLGELPVDFSTQMVLVAGLGPTPSSDLGIRITRVWQQDSRVRVQETQIHPGTDEPVGLNPASPWTMAVVPRSDLNVEGYSLAVPRDLFSTRKAFGGGAAPPAPEPKSSKRKP